jgi:hypothetical protein
MINDCINTDIRISPTDKVNYPRTTYDPTTAVCQPLVEEVKPEWLQTWIDHKGLKNVGVKSAISWSYSDIRYSHVKRLKNKAKDVSKHHYIKMR